MGQMKAALAVDVRVDRHEVLALVQVEAVRSSFS